MKSLLYDDHSKVTTLSTRNLIHTGTFIISLLETYIGTMDIVEKEMGDIKSGLQPKS